MSIFDDGDASRRRRCIWRRSLALALLGEDGDYVVAFGRGHSLSCVRLTVNLVLHKEMSLLLEVDVAVCAGVAFGVTELVSQLHHHSAEIQITRFVSKDKFLCNFFFLFFFLNHRSCVLQWCHGLNYILKCFFCKAKKFLLKLIIRSADFHKQDGMQSSRFSQINCF